jgi:hypothetical protein
MITTMICVKWCLTRYPTKNIRYRRYPCPISSVFDPRLSVFIFANIHICIRIRSYLYSNSNPNKNMKTNMISLISVRIQSDYTPIYSRRKLLFPESGPFGRTVHLSVRCTPDCPVGATGPSGATQISPTFSFFHSNFVLLLLT